MARAYGSGSKRERSPGVWELRAAGRSATFRGTGKAAEKELARLVTDTSSRQNVKVGRTFGELIDRWLEAAQIETSTRGAYERALATHLPAEVRAWKLTKLRLADFDALYARLSRAGVTPYAVRKLHTALSAALTEGLRWQWIETHPARGARLPAVSVRPATMPAAAALGKLLEVSKRDRQTRVWFLLALATGARRSELLALRWSQVDLERARVGIVAALRSDRTVKGTKTNRVRFVAIDPDTVDVLRSWRIAQKERALAAGAALVADPFVLSNVADSGTPWRPDGATQRFGRLRTAAGVDEKIRLNDLRHAHVSILLAEGIPIGDVSPRVGHSRQSTTQDVYSHQLDGGDRRAATAIGDAIRKLGSA